MRLSIDNITLEVPNHISDVTLRRRMEYDLKYGDEINERITEIDKDSKLTKEQKEDKFLDVILFRAQSSLAFFSRRSLAKIQKMNAAEVAAIYNQHISGLLDLTPCEDLDTSSILIKDNVYWLPEHELTPSSEISFGELIVAKEIGRNLCTTSSDKLHAIAQLGTVFLRPLDKNYNEAEVGNDELLKFMFDLPMDIALRIGAWYDRWSDYVQKNFSVFEKGKKNKKSIDMSAHFDKWGWISFMNYVAQNATIFYKSNGLSNLDNIKQTKAYDVLLWASCQKDEEKILQQHQDNMDRKNRQ